MQTKSLFITALFLYTILSFSCLRIDNFPIGKKVVCKADIIDKDKKQFVSNTHPNILFDGANKQIKTVGFDDNYSVFTTPGKKAFAFGIKLYELTPDSYFKVSVWRKSKDGKGALVVSSQDAKKFYKANSDAVAKHENGWEKLEVEFFVPPLVDNDYFVIYAWNNGSDTVYYDNIEIERLKSKKYPDYTNIQQLNIILDTNQYIKIANKRKQAINNGILQSSDNDWAKTMIFADSNLLKSKIRLKGDWLDHLLNDKWSFRIKLKKNYSWNRLRTFSIQTPLARNFLLEWTSHKFYDKCDILTTRYGFVNVFINNNNKGLFAYEEHFVKQLLESRKRREGPILKFDEDAFWQCNKFNINTKKWPALPFFATSVIRPFSSGKTIESPNLKNQFLNGQRLLSQYKNLNDNAVDVFDKTKLARYFAMLDITHARHGMAWHNQRFYFNPIICKLEPIAFDGYTDHSEPDLSINDNIAHVILNQKEILPEQVMFYNFFLDKDFVTEYLKQLELISSEEFVKEFNESIKKDETLYDSLLHIEFDNYHYDFDFISKSAKEVRSYLPELKKNIFNYPNFSKGFSVKKREVSSTNLYENTPEFFVNAYLQKRQSDSLLVRVFNYYPTDIKLVGTGTNNKYIFNYFENQVDLTSNTNGPTNTEILADTTSTYLFFTIEGSDELFKVEINPWPEPEGPTPQQLLVKNYQAEQYTFISIKDDVISLSRKDITLTTPLIIPEGYKFVLEEGTNINLLDSAMIISYSPVYFNGTKSKPIVIRSDDFTANAFTVLQADKRSKLENVRFENLNTLNYKGWTLTGAVTFYESDVDLKNVYIYRNQCEDALNIVRSDFTLTNCGFQYTWGDAFDSDFSTGTLEKVYFDNIGNDAIDFSGSQIAINNTTINSAQDKGISGGEESHLTVSNCVINNSNIGIASKDLSIVEVDNTQINDCNYGLVLLQKKPEYGPAKIILNSVNFKNPKTEKLIEIGSVVVENGKTIKGKEKNAASLFY